MSSNLRAIVIAACLLAGGAILLRYLDHLYPVRQWIIWDFARIWAWQLVFCLSAASAGLAVVERCLATHKPPLAERMVLAMAVGTGLFAVGMFAGGAARLFGPVFATLLPIVLFASGARRFAALVRELYARWRERNVQMAPLDLLLGAAGVFAVGLLYLQCLSPDSITYDAAWSHLTIAEDYAREGRIVPFAGSVPKTLPHLHSLLYTWCFTVPGLQHPALKWMASLHLEFVLFLWTLFALVPAIRWLANAAGGTARAAWTARFLFPGIFVYDFNLGGGSDHIAGFFGLPLLFAIIIAARTLSPGAAVIAGFLAGAALHTKYQCVQLVAPAALLFVGVQVASWWRTARGHGDPDQPTTVPPWTFARVLRTVGFLWLGGAVSLGPHLIRNVFFYGNPIYPFLATIFPTHPIFPDAATVTRYLGVATDRLPPVELSRRVVSSIGLLATFPFTEPMSAFGFLTVLLMPIGIFLRGTARLRIGLLLGAAAIFVWAFTYRVDRNLQLVVPWLAAVSGAAIVVAWRSGGLVRAAVALLVLVQVAWGGRFVLAGGIDRTRSSLDMLARDVGRNAAGRYDAYRAGFRELGAAIPERGVLLLHMGHLHLGVNRTTVEDWVGSQYLIDYRTMRTARDVYERFHAVGITHMAWNNYDYSASRAQDVLFVAFSRRFAAPKGVVGGFTVWEMPSEAPPETGPIQATLFGLPGYGDGRYEVGKLTTFDWYPPEAKSYPPPDFGAQSPEERRAALARSDVLLLTQGYALDPDTTNLVTTCFKLEAEYQAGYAIHLRVQTPHCSLPPPR